MIDFDQLVRAVEESAPTGNALDRLATASSISTALSLHADALLGHYVEACRREGHSWSEIGRELGVSKQAAQKRFVDMPLGRVTPLARVVLEAAQRMADDQGASAVRLDHLVLALFGEPTSIGAKVLRELGVTRDALDDAIVKRSRVAGANLGSEPSADQAVLTAALQLGHNYVGTEHILLACDQEPKPMITVVLDEMGAPAAVIRERVIAALHGSS